MRKIEGIEQFERRISKIARCWFVQPVLSAQARLVQVSLAESMDELRPPESFQAKTSQHSRSSSGHGVTDAISSVAAFMARNPLG